MHWLDKLSQRVHVLLKDRRELERLLLLEKEKRGFTPEKLVFVGMKNVAEYYWCAMKALLTSRKEETGFFANYLADRASYSFKLGLTKSLPKSREELLHFGSEITLTDVNRLLKEKAKRFEESRREGVEGELVFDAVPSQDGMKCMVNPNLPEEERSAIEKKMRDRGFQIVDLTSSSDAISRGNLLEGVNAEKYSSIRWNFQWHNYVLVGVPDGITDTLVYEYKTTQNRFLLSFIRQPAFSQASLYAYFFKRREKRVQVCIVEEGVTETWHDLADDNEALKVLADFESLDGSLIPKKPRAWKCKSCEFKPSCPLTGNT
jgi:hypothetical protein